MVWHNRTYWPGPDGRGIELGFVAIESDDSTDVIVIHAMPTDLRK